jgi:hypothetical protein
MDNQVGVDIAGIRFLMGDMAATIRRMALWSGQLIHWVLREAAEAGEYAGEDVCDQ